MRRLSKEPFQGVAGQPDARWKNTVFLVEADDFAMHQLWSRFALESENRDPQRAVRWEQDSRGLSRRVGNLWTGTSSPDVPERPLPVMCQVTFAELEGFRVAFYTAVSRVVDWNAVHEWVRKQAPSADRCDAQDFSKCLRRIRELATLTEVHES